MLRPLRMLALALCACAFGAVPLAAQQIDSTAVPHMMSPVVVHASYARVQRASLAGNARLEREIARYDRRIDVLELRLDSLKVRADSLDRDRIYFEAAADHARMRRSRIEARLRALEREAESRADSARATPH